MMITVNEMTYIDAEKNNGGCCFDARAYCGAPDTAPTARTVPVPEIISRLDGLYSRGLEKEAREFLDTWRGCAHARGDWRGELSLLSELMGLYRRTDDDHAAIKAIDDGLAIIREHGMGSTVSGATVLLNAATTLKAFGKAEESIPMFVHVCRVYSDNLDPSDYRFAGLYNNMALSYDDAGDRAQAEKYFGMAIAVIKTCPHPENELAVTYCNMAHMYDRADPEDPRIGEYMEKAWECLDAPGLPRDGYYAFTASKCAPAFSYFGYFVYARELETRAGRIYAGT